jgi:hypothetical protein
MCFSVSLSSSLSIGCLFLGHYWFNCSLLEADEWGVHAESMLISWNIHFWEAIVRWCLDDIFIVVIFFHLSRILCFWLPPRVSFFGQYFFFFFLLCLFLVIIIIIFRTYFFFSWPFLVIFFCPTTPDPKFFFDFYVPPPYLQDQVVTKPT